MTLDETDRRILRILQRDSNISMDALGSEVALSRNACWRRIKILQESGVIKGSVTLLDPAALDLPLMVFLQVRTDRHDPEWLDQFAAATRRHPEVLGVYRMSGDLDYLIRARVADMAGYDRLYQKLIRDVPMSDMSASFVMEEIKETTALPL